MLHANRVLAAVTVLAATIATVALADGKHKHHFAPDVEAFHAQLSPLWHAAASPERSTAVCKATPELSRLATAITSADASALKSSIETLQKHCSNNSDVEVPFTAVHDAFHVLTGE